MIIERTMDLLEAPVDLIVHQVNCKGVMGAGLAKQIKTRYPEVYARYCMYCRHTPLSELLGTVQIIKTQSKLVGNLYAQLGYGRDRRYTDYEALKRCFMKVRKFMLQHELQSVGVPSYIGCGLAGGDWKIVSQIIQDVFADSSITVVLCRKD